MDGILNIYKEAGYTSHDVVAKLRGICRQKNRPDGGGRFAGLTWKSDKSV